MFQLVSAAVVVLAWSLPRPDEGKLSAQEVQRLADLEAARNARYYFSSDVQDQINDLTQHRDELRDGLKVRGSFSYSDGFLRRQVSYEADENGYRIIRDDIQPLPGPRLNPDGTASVRAVLDGAENSYRIGLAKVPAESQL